MSLSIAHQLWDIVDYGNMVGNGFIPVCNAKKGGKYHFEQAVFVPQDVSFDYSDFSS